jgi:magnesium chelatase subunit I
MKRALILNLIDPRVGGVMITGDRGTGKSTIVRSVVDLLPQIEVAKGDSCNSSVTDYDLMSNDVKRAIEKGNDIEREFKRVPMVDLPLGATEDRVCGTIDSETAVRAGVKIFEPGLLAKANRGILYVDEINLLDDHLVDVLLDSAASGWNTVEREGISIKHPARFVLIGSGNPEEGELRPQLLDRFGMEAQVRTTRNACMRLRIVQDCMKFETDPKGFLKGCTVEQKWLANSIVDARSMLPKIQLSPEFSLKISQVCNTLCVDGLRGDIVVTRAARAHAAFERRESVCLRDIEKVICLCLRHRVRGTNDESPDVMILKAFNEWFSLENYNTGDGIRKSNTPRKFYFGDTD